MKAKSTKFFPKNENISFPRLVGYKDIDSTVDAAMQYILRDRDFYREHIRKDLERCGRSIVSRYSSSCYGLVVYFDPNHIISDRDYMNLPDDIMYKKYPTFHLIA